MSNDVYNGIGMMSPLPHSVDIDEIQRQMALKKKLQKTDNAWMRQIEADVADTIGFWENDFQNQPNPTSTEPSEGGALDQLIEDVTEESADQEKHVNDSISKDH